MQDHILMRIDVMLRRLSRIYIMILLCQMKQMYGINIGFQWDLNVVVIMNFTNHLEYLRFGYCAIGNFELVDKGKT